MARVVLNGTAMRSSSPRCSFRCSFLCCFLVLACGGADDPTAPPDASPTGDAASLAIAWEPCPVRSDGVGTGAECAEIAVPVRWDAPAGPTLTLFVKRILAQASPARGQLWALNGGPGGPGADYEDFVEGVAPFLVDLDYYLIDHRGTGRSSRLGCAAEADLVLETAEWPACAAELAATWGERLEGFRTTEAARDLGELIERTRAPGQEVHIHGGSYGTYLAQRYLQLYPTQATAVSLLGIAPPTISFADYDVWFDRVGGDYLAACGADASCAARLGADPAARIRSLFARLDAGHCPGAAAVGLDRGALRRLFAALIFFSWEERALVPALAYRLERCSAADVDAVEVFAARAFAPQAPTIYDRLQAPVLGMHIGQSELWSEPGPSIGELDAVIAGALFSTELGSWYGPTRATWPRYAPDALDGAWATTAVPMLMMNGSLDPATPLALAESLRDRFTAPHQRFVAIPGADHSWLAPVRGGGLSCTIQLFLAFHHDPTAPLDTSCVATIEPLAFEGSSALAAGAFGTTDLWENVAAKPGALAVSAGAARLREIFTRARRVGRL